MPEIPGSTYKAPWWMANRHLLTVIPVLFRKVHGVAYTRTKIETPDGDFLNLDVSRVGADRCALVLHGLEGDAGRGYMRGMVKALNKRGWDAWALNFRGCGGEPNKTARMYHSGDTTDIHTVITHITGLNVYAKIALVGFSLGGNVILKYLGERGKAVPDIVAAAVGISVPCDLAGCSIELEAPENRRYARRFLRMLRTKMRQKAEAWPGRVSIDGYDRIQTLREFDDRYTAPLHGFEDAAEYYAKSSSNQFLQHIAIPTLLINAKDDPFLSPGCFPSEQAAANPHLFLQTPEQGGHVGFVTYNRDREYWSETRAGEFLNEHVHHGAGA